LPERLVAFNNKPDRRIDSNETIRVRRLNGYGSKTAKVIHAVQKTMWKIRNHGEPKAVAAQSDIL
jgi:hypothetical protein